MKHIVLKNVIYLGWDLTRPRHAKFQLSPDSGTHEGFRMGFTEWARRELGTADMRDVFTGSVLYAEEWELDPAVFVSRDRQLLKPENHPRWGDTVNICVGYRVWVHPDVKLYAVQFVSR